MHSWLFAIMANEKQIIHFSSTLGCVKVARNVDDSDYVNDSAELAYVFQRR